MFTRRTARILSAVVSATALVAGCSGTSGSGQAGATSAGQDKTGRDKTPTAAQTGAVTWADGVCSASIGLGSAVHQLTGTLQVDPAGSGATLGRALAQIPGRVSAVHQQADQLRAAIIAVPADADERVTAAQQQLQAAADRARGGVNQLSDAAAELAGAQTRAAKVARLATMTGALSVVTGEVQAYLGSLRAAAGDREDVVRDTFAAAPACRTVTTPAVYLGPVRYLGSA
jgi:hypothetical protein